PRVSVVADDAASTERRCPCDEVLTGGGPDVEMRRVLTPRGFRFGTQFEQWADTVGMPQRGHVAAAGTRNPPGDRGPEPGVAFGVGENRPRHVALSDVGVDRAETEQPL